MKKYVLSLSLFILFFSGYSQDCKYSRNEIDPYTKVKKLETFPVKVFDWFKSLKFQWGNYDGDKYLIANINISGENLIFETGDLAIFLFDDGSTFELELLSEGAKQVSNGELYWVGGNAHYYYKFFYPVNENIKNELSEGRLTGVRFYNEIKYYEFPVKSNKRRIRNKLDEFFTTDWKCVHF